MSEITGGDKPHNVARKQNPVSNILKGNSNSGHEENLAETMIKASVPRLTGAEVLGHKLPDCKVA
jgi:hypothetical protein